jgi:putative Ca2+/H+ antiporter (TMEM165/GDT1 family)
LDIVLISLLLVFALANGGRDQWLVAQFSDALGRSAPLLLFGMACAALSAALMAWLGTGLAELLPRRAGQILVAVALALAAVELVWPIKLAAPREPTRSLGAIAIVLAARQVGDAGRIAVFALAAWAHSPVTAALGGALGGAGAIALGWSLGAAGLARWPLAKLRRVLAAALLVAAVHIGMGARVAA